MPRSTSVSTTSTWPFDFEIFSPPRSRNSLCIHVPHPRVHVERALALGHLVGVVHADVVDAAGVDVEALARGTWWPSPSTRCASRGSRGPTASPTPAGAARPGGGELPEREVGRVALGLDVLDPAAGGQLVEVEVGEVGVARGRSTRRSTRRRRSRRCGPAPRACSTIAICSAMCDGRPRARGRARGSRGGAGRSAHCSV